MEEGVDIIHVNCLTRTVIGLVGLCDGCFFTDIIKYFSSKLFIGVL